MCQVWRVHGVLVRRENNLLMLSPELVGSKFWQFNLEQTRTDMTELYLGCTSFLFNFTTSFAGWLDLVVSSN